MRDSFGDNLGDTLGQITYTTEQNVKQNIQYNIHIVEEADISQITVVSITSTFSRIGGLYTFLAVLVKALLTEQVRQNQVKDVAAEIKTFST